MKTRLLTLLLVALMSTAGCASDWKGEPGPGAYKNERAKQQVKKLCKNPKDWERWGYCEPHEFEHKKQILKR